MLTLTLPPDATAAERDLAEKVADVAWREGYRAGVFHTFDRLAQVLPAAAEEIRATTRAESPLAPIVTAIEALRAAMAPTDSLTHSDLSAEIGQISEEIANLRGAGQAPRVSVVLRDPATGLVSSIVNKLAPENLP